MKRTAALAPHVRRSGGLLRSHVGHRLGGSARSCGVHSSTCRRSLAASKVEVMSASSVRQDGDATVWNCADFFAATDASVGEVANTDSRGDVSESDGRQPGQELALIIANSPIPKLHHHYFPFLWNKARVKVCADGGGNRLFAYDKRRFVPDIIAGDMDSLRPSVREYYRKRGSTIVRIREQDSTDLEKCIHQIQDIEQRQGQQFTNICVVGGLGGNFSHEIANVNILYKNQQRRVFLLSEVNLTFLLVPGRHVIRTNIPIGTHGHKRRIFCSLIPLGSKCNSITTKGLRWDMSIHQWPADCAFVINDTFIGAGTMEFGGLVSTSNEMAAESAEVQVSDPVLWTFDIRPEEQLQTQHLGADSDLVEEIRAHAFDHRDELETSEVCGCLHCLSTFPPSQIKVWTNFKSIERAESRPEGDTAVCPSCNSQSTVVGSSSGFEITREMLSRIKAYNRT